jgi:cell division protein FtsW
MSYSGLKRKRRRPAAKADPGIWVPAVSLMTAGTFLVLSASAILASDKFSGSGFFWARQLIWWVVALGAMYVCSRLDYRKLMRFAPSLLGLGFVALVVVLWADPVRGAHRWLRLGPLVIQPSELFRLADLIVLAFSLARRQEKMRKLGYLVSYIIILGAASGLLLAEPSFSAVLCLWGTTVLLFWIAGLPKRYILGAGAIAVLAAVVIVFGFEYKKSRVDNYLAMVADPTDGCYQVNQAAIAMGSGGLFGCGLGSGWGKMHYIPDPHTDFIFASIAEETGLLGALVVLVLYLAIIWRGFAVAARAPDRVGFFLAAGISASLVIHVGMNIGVVMGLIPTTGLPLPLLSYGGSSLLFTAVGIGLLLSVSRWATPERY